MGSIQSPWEMERQDLVRFFAVGSERGDTEGIVVMVFHKAMLGGLGGYVLTLILGRRKEEENSNKENQEMLLQQRGAETAVVIEGATGRLMSDRIRRRI
jgi:hypothetical protein